MHSVHHLLKLLNLVVQHLIGLVLLIYEMDDAASASYSDSAPAQLFELRNVFQVLTITQALRLLLDLLELVCVTVH